MQAMHTQVVYCSRSICVVAAESVKLPQGQGVGSLAPQWKALPQRGQCVLGVVVTSVKPAYRARAAVACAGPAEPPGEDGLMAAKALSPNSASPTVGFPDVCAHPGAAHNTRQPRAAAVKSQRVGMRSRTFM
jgi:hypothetical protein